MAKPTALCLIFCLSVLSCSQVKKVQHIENLPSAVPVLNIINDTTASPIKISSLNVDVSIASNIATTTFDIVFYNPNDRILEGEFEFPLADGQTIVRYALDIDGKLREGVVVEKAKARVAYESTIRQKIDPGLLEKTKGNNFRTRIYPLPAKGNRHILIAIEQTLQQRDKDLFYQLPLSAASVIDKFSINALVVKSSAQPETAGTDIAGFNFKSKDNSWLAAQNQNNFIGNHNFIITIPTSSDNEKIILTENHNSQTYFYANSRIEPEYKKKQTPSSVGILWDISAFSEKRNIDKEKKLLQEYLRQAGNVNITLLPFHVAMLDKEEFIISGGNSDALIKRIQQFTYDGGTQFGAIDLSKYSFDEVLIFSDGLSTFGKKEISLSSYPAITINSSPSADFSNLQYIAQQTHGKFIDLTKMETEVAIIEIQNQSLQIINVEYNPSEIEDLVTQLSPISDHGLSFSGKLKATSAEVTVMLGFGSEVIKAEKFTVIKPEKSEHDQVKRIWAGMMVNKLDLQFENNKAPITKLGKEFSIVTQNTSLIVLDRVEDYVEHEIIPPLELLEQYNVLLSEKMTNKTNEKETALNEAIEAMQQLKEWWNTDYQKKYKELITKKFTPPVIAIDEEIVASDVRLEEAPDSSRVGRGFNGTYNLSVSDSVGYSFYSTNGNNMMVSESELLIIGGEVKKISYNKPVEPSIELNEWKSDAPYLKELEKTSAEKRIEKYFLLKKQYAAQPSFFIDVARFFIENKQHAFGIQVLSNVVEMKLEDAELLRMVANQLLDAGEKELAVETFKEIMNMREEEPQSYRDLAIAYNETGKYKEAVELLYKLITSTWDSRFGDIKSIALNEMNAIITAHAGLVNTSSIDNRFIYAMPVDVRIVIGWSADNADVDLWVTDPAKQKCSYEQKETNIGGKLSADVTQGYGPEEFCLKQALNGNYRIEVNLFGDSRQTLGGPIAIKAELFTNFGKPSQKREVINFRVTDNKEVINLGSLNFGSSH